MTLTNLRSSLITAGGVRAYALTDLYRCGGVERKAGNDMCGKECLANDNGRCVAYEGGFKNCGFAVVIRRMMRLYEVDSDFAYYVNNYMSHHKTQGLNYAFIVKIVNSYGEQIIREKGYTV